MSLERTLLHHVYQTSSYRCRVPFDQPSQTSPSGLLNPAYLREIHGLFLPDALLPCCRHHRYCSFTVLVSCHRGCNRCWWLLPQSTAPSEEMSPSPWKHPVYTFCNSSCGPLRRVPSCHHMNLRLTSCSVYGHVVGQSCLSVSAPFTLPFTNNAFITSVLS